MQGKCFDRLISSLRTNAVHYRGEHKLLSLSPVALAEKRLMDVKLGEFFSWLGTRDFTPNGLIGSVRKGKVMLVHPTAKS